MLADLTLLRPKPNENSRGQDCASKTAVAASTTAKNEASGLAAIVKVQGRVAPVRVEEAAKPSGEIGHAARRPG